MRDEKPQLDHCSLSSKQDLEIGEFILRSILNIMVVVAVLIYSLLRCDGTIMFEQRPRFLTHR